MPFELSNAPAIFQRAINYIIQNLEGTSAYPDNWVITSQSSLSLSTKHCGKMWCVAVVLAVVIAVTEGQVITYKVNNNAQPGVVIQVPSSLQPVLRERLNRPCRSARGGCPTTSLCLVLLPTTAPALAAPLHATCRSIV